ncbi:uncharacterized protein CCOS01_15335, partial [Colletotrichum costaricense]
WTHQANVFSKPIVGSQPLVHHKDPFEFSTKTFDDWKASPLPSIRLPEPSGFPSIKFLKFSGTDNLSRAVNFKLSPDEPLDMNAVPDGYALLKVTGRCPMKTQVFQVRMKMLSDASVRWAQEFKNYPNQRAWAIHARPEFISDLMTILHSGFLPYGPRRSFQDILALCYLARQHFIMDRVRRELNALLHASTAMTNQELWYIVLAAQPLCCDNQDIGHLAFNILVWRHAGSFYPLRETQFLEEDHLFHYEESKVIANMEGHRHSFTLQLCEVASMVDPSLLRTIFLRQGKDRSLWEKLTYLQHFCHLKFPKLPLGSGEWSFEAVLNQESLQMAVVRDDIVDGFHHLYGERLWPVLRDIWLHIAEISNEYVLS